MLTNYEWELRYTPDSGNLVEIFYVPALKCAVRYDRLTGYFSAGALTLAARGIEGLVQNGGHMRLVVGCTLDQKEIAAIKEGERLRESVELHLKGQPLLPATKNSRDALELLVWMVAHGHLDIKVAVPCDDQRRPIPATGIFHEKTGVIQDSAGNRIAWNGSLNETARGWKENWESMHVYVSWGAEPARVDQEESNFDLLWSDKATRVMVLDMPEAMRRDLMRFMPKQDLPARLREPSAGTEESELAVWRSRVWSFISQAPAMPAGGEWVGEATAPIDPWPHQVLAFKRMYDNWPPKLLIADEVGLGKTIQAGLLLRQAWLAGRAKRILILAPKAVLKQWQIELREKFNLHWPIYDGRQFTWYSDGQAIGKNEYRTRRRTWHKESVVLASSHLMRRRDRAAEVLEKAANWDLVVLDEAHHARRKGAGSWNEGGPNNLLAFMQGLKRKCDGLILLTATPMQVAPIEVWDLLSLLDLPEDWTEKAFLDFYENIGERHPTPERLASMARLFNSSERFFGEVGIEDTCRKTGLSRLKAGKVLRALRDRAKTPIRQLGFSERLAAVQIMRDRTPISQLISRNTRELLRDYYKRGLLKTRIADRKVTDCFIELTSRERELYEAVNEYIRTTYNRASEQERSAVGLVMVIYRRRLASSFRALAQTLGKRIRALMEEDAVVESQDEDLPDDETADDILGAEDIVELEHQALAFEEAGVIQDLLERIKALPPDSKATRLRREITKLRDQGYSQAMVFTQFTDTIDFLRRELRQCTEWRLMCFTGRGGEVPSGHESWRKITRDDAKRQFSAGEADVLLCSEAAAEGLNFQFCGALINYDMPWNPMKVEQRIGRIDRLGQRHNVIRIINLHYKDTIETDVYIALRERINIFESIVGNLQPILSNLSKRIESAVLKGDGSENLLESIVADVEDSEMVGFEIDSATNEGQILPRTRPSPVTMEDLDRVLRIPVLLPSDVQIGSLGHREYKMLREGSESSLRITSDPEYYEKHADSVDLWSPGNPHFPRPNFERIDIQSEKSLSAILEQGPNGKAE